MENTSKINILIGTPAYNSMVHMDFMNSILDLHKNKVPFTLMMIGNESLITRGRNTIISFFNEMKEFSHLLFLDADIGISALDIIKLIQYNVDIIGVPVALKGLDQYGKKIYNIVNPIKSKNNELYEVDKVGTAVFMLSRKSVDSLISNAILNNDIYTPNEHMRTTIKQPVMYDIFKTTVEDKIYLSEDFYVCKKLKELGYTIYVDDKIMTIHNGMYRF